jgi:hypothetical protein
MFKSLLVACIAVGVVTVVPERIEAQKGLPALDAEMKTTYAMSDGRQSTVDGHYYRSSTGELREDSPLGSLITNFAKRTVTVLKESTKEARVVSVGPPSDTTRRESLPPAKPVGEGVVEGFRVTKVRMEDANGGSQEIWTAPDLGLIVFSRVESRNMTTTRVLSKIRLAEPSRAVFAVPDGYKVNVDRGR